MACSIIRNKENNEIEKVLAPNGKESILYQSILEIQPDKEKALQIWAQVYTPTFKAWFGDWEKSSPVKEGVSQLFDSNPELASIGTVEQYSAYLDTIFPNSQVKDIVYHGTSAKFDKFERGFRNADGRKTNTEGFHLIAAVDKEYYRRKYNGLISAVINFKNPVSARDGNYERALEYLNETDILYFKSKGFDSGIKFIDDEDGSFEYVAFESEQIHILGSKDDVSGFKEFVSSGTVNQSSKVVDDNGEPLLVYHGTGNEFVEFDKELRGITTGRSTTGEFDAENAFFFTDNQNVAFNYAIMARQQELELISYSLQRITKNFYSKESSQEAYNNLRTQSPKFAKYVDGLKAKGLNSAQIMDNLKVMANKYYQLNKDYGQGGSISNPRRYYNDMEIEVNRLEQKKKEILSGKYVSVSKFGPDSNVSFSLGYESVYINTTGNVYGKIKEVPELSQGFSGNITNFTSTQFDQLITGLRSTIKQGRSKIEDDIVKGGFTPKLMPVFLKINSPEIKDFKGEPFVMQMDGKGAANEASKLVLDAVKSNKDGVILEKIKDPELANNYAVFEPNQIKSVFNQGTFSEENNNIYLQAEPQSEVPPKKDINKSVEQFLEKIGVSVMSVRTIRDRNGVPISAIAKADMLNKIIEVIENKADITTLPEEAAHFFVEMLGENHPLFKQMMDKITGYKLYSQVVEQYRKSPLYRKPDGTLDVNKIKKEAIGKLIALHVIGQDPVTETEAKLKEAMTWWNKVWEFVKSIFDSRESNPFAEAATDILRAETKNLNMDFQSDEEFLQMEGDFESLINDQAKIHLDNSIDPLTKQKRHIYYYEGEKANGSVTSTYVDKWLRKIFRSDNRTEGQKLLDLSKAEFGDQIHSESENIIKSLTNPDGTVAANPSPVAPVTNAQVFSALQKYIKSIMNEHNQPGTVFKSEVKIYDKKAKIAGSMDLLVIEPDGTVHIYDWKSQEIGKGQEDIKPYKEEMYRIQLRHYRDILQNQYGFTKFGKVRAVPMKTTFVFNSGKIDRLQSIEIGDIDPLKIPDSQNYLLPVTLKTESTGSLELDSLLERLNGIYDKLKNTRYTREEALVKREELGRLRVVMRDLHLRQRVNKLIDLGLVEYKKYMKAIENGTLSGKDIIEAGKIMAVFAESGQYLTEIMEDHLKAAKEANDPDAMNAFQNTQIRFNSMRSNVESLLRRIEQYRDEEARKLGEANGIVNLLNAEAPVGVLNGMFSALSKITQKSFRTFAAILRRVQNRRDAKFNKMIDEMTVIKENFIKWAGSKGLSLQKAQEMLLNIDENGNWDGNFLAKYKKEFYTERDKAINDGSLKWFAANTSFDLDKYKIREKEQLEFFNSIPHSVDEAENKKIIAQKMKDWVENHLVFKGGKVNEKALTNKSNQFLTPTDKWVSDQWNTLNAPENAPLLAVYDYFQEMIKYSKKLGMLDNYSGRFIPSIHATKVEQLVFGDIKGLFDRQGFFDQLETDADNMYTPQIDPTDGSIINKVPVYFTRDMGIVKENGVVDYSRKSRDIFKVFSIWGAHMYNYEAMESIEDDAMVLLEAERNKKSLVTDQFNNIILEEGKVKAINSNDRNAKLLETFVNFYLYNRQSGQMNDTEFSVPFSDKKYSVLKTASAAMAFFSFKTLALNPISGTAQFVGGQGNALFMAQKGKQFTKSEWAEAMYKVAGQDKTAKAALNYFDVLLEGTSNMKSNSMSLSPGNKILTADNGYIIQRTMDKSVQNPIAVAMMLRHMIDENGNIVDIEEFVKAKYDYNNTFYKLKPALRDETAKKINQEVGELKKTKNLLVVGTVDDKGKFSLPGLDTESEAWGKFRSKIKAVNKRIIGNASHDDINAIRTSMLGSALMQFRSWIPEMAEERFAGLKYDDELQQWTYGKMNLFFGELFSKRMPALLKSIVTGFGENGIEAARAKYEELRREAAEKGQEFTITEGEFIDLYIANVRSEFMELMVVLSFAALVFSVVKVGDDDDEQTKGFKKYARKALNKYYNEFAFYYNPVEFTNLVKSPLPVIGLAEDVTRFSTNLAKEIYGAGFDQEVQDNAKPSKYFFRMVPIAKQSLDVMATFDDDFRKEWDIRVQ